MQKRSKARFIARTIEGSCPAADMPRFIEPMKPTPLPEPPVGSKWIHEIKFDGYRIQPHMRGGRVRIYSSNGNDITQRFAPIYAGKVGTGFSNEASRKLRDKLEETAAKNSPLHDRTRKPNARWVHRYYARKLNTKSGNRPGHCVIQHSRD